MCLFAFVGLLAIVSVSPSQVMSKFSLRNLSGSPIAVWWIEVGGSKLIPQAAVTVRNTSAIEINSFRGHRFVVRKFAEKTSLSTIEYVPEAGDAILEIGATNDIVVVNERMELVKHDAAFKTRVAVREALDACGETEFATCAAEALEETLVGWREAWLEEEALRVGMTEEVVTLGGAEPALPVAPQNGWPTREIESISRALRSVPLRCGPFRPPEPGRFPSGGASREILEAVLARWHVDLDDRYKGLEDEVWSAARDRDAERVMCGRWAAIGECRKNPGYMRDSCKHACELHDAYGTPADASVDAVLDGGRDRDDFDECVAAALDASAQGYIGAASAEQNAKSLFNEELRNLTCKHVVLAGTQAPHYAGGDSPGAEDGSSRSASAPMVGPDGHEFRAVPLWRGSKALPAANITLLEGFATRDECAHAMNVARPNLKPATVNEENDAAAKSLSRRAYAANLVPRLNDENDLGTKLWMKAFKMANELTGYGLDHRGQEPFSVIHYNGTRVGHTDLPDEYRPHCDGGCDGSPHMHGGRVATMLLYCEVPTKGGATTFSNARTAVKPKALDAVFFSYYDKDTNAMDTGHTLHSGCPVLEGEKWVMTLWMRKGVHEHDSWTQYDPTGARHL